MGKIREERIYWEESQKRKAEEEGWNNICTLAYKGCPGANDAECFEANCSRSKTRYREDCNYLSGISDSILKILGL